MKSFTPPPAPDQTYIKGGQLADTGTVFVISKCVPRTHPKYGEMLDFVIVQLDKPVPKTKLHGVLSLQRDESREEIMSQIDPEEPLGPCGMEKVGNYLRIVDRPTKKEYEKTLDKVLTALAESGEDGEELPF